MHSYIIHALYVCFEMFALLGKFIKFGKPKKITAWGSYNAGIDDLLFLYTFILNLSSFPFLSLFFLFFLP